MSAALADCIVGTGLRRMSCAGVFQCPKGVFTIAAIAWDSLNPFPWYRAMRKSSPVLVDTSGTIHVFGYDQVKRVLSDYEYFSSHFGEQDPDHPLSASLISIDPPRHQELRALVSQAFTPRAVDRLAPRIDAITQTLWNNVKDAVTIDIVADLAYPLPVIVIAEMMGIPSDHRAQFKAWSDAVVTGSRQGKGEGPPNTSTGAQREMARYFRDLVALRRRTPGDDLISGLMAAQWDGHQLSEAELLGFCVLLLVAGNETTTNLITNAVDRFADTPEILEQLRQHPEQLPLAIEEILRYRSPVQSMYRICRQDTSLEDIAVRAGQPLVAWIGSANQDENHFTAPTRMDIGRKPNRHLAFGHGIHACLGAPLARLEAKIALQELLKRVHTLKLLPGHQREPIGSSVVMGFKTLPVAVEWEKG